MSELYTKLKFPISNRGTITRTHTPCYADEIHLSGPVLLSHARCMSFTEQDCFIGYSTLHESPVINKPVYNPTNDNNHIVCTYDINKIDNVNQNLGLFKEFFKNDCLKVVDNQSILFSPLHPYFKFCRLIFNNMSENEQETEMTILCNAHKTLPECACLNRRIDNDYRTQQQNMGGISDNCWYAPCKPGNYTYVPSNVRSSKCPDQLCQTSTTITGKVVNAQNINNKISCTNYSQDLKQSQTTNADTNLHDNKTSINTTKIENYSFYIIGVIIFIIILIFIMNN